MEENKYTIEIPSELIDEEGRVCGIDEEPKSYGVSEEGENAITGEE